MANASGYARDLLLAASMIFKGANPETKITPPGALRACLDASKPQILSNMMDEATGHVKDIKMKFRPRSKPGTTSSSYSCNADEMRAYEEASITSSLFRQKAIYFRYDTLAKFSAEATVLRNAKGIPPRLGGFFNEVWSTLASEANGLFADIDIDVLTKLALSFGVNQTTGLNTAKTVNFPLSTTTNDMTTGMTGITADIQANEMNMDRVGIIGSGLINNYYIQNVYKNIKSADASGVNTAAFNMPKYYNDPYAASSLGANNFAIVDMEALQFLDLNTNQGFQADDFGTSVFFTMPLPIVDSDGNTTVMNFDVQVKFYDCPTTLVDSYGVSKSIGKGIVVFLRKAFDIYVPPGAMYTFGDRIFQNNGTLLYHATNS